MNRLLAVTLLTVSAASLCWGQQPAAAQKPVTPPSKTEQKPAAPAADAAAPAKTEAAPPQNSAIADLRKKADAGDVASMVKLGDMYSIGREVGRNLPEAAKLYKKAADAGNADALMKIGIMTEGGFGIQRDPQAAIKMYEKAASAGIIAAQMRLGTLYENGMTVEKSGSKAIQYYTMAADLNDQKAQLKLADLYRRGIEEVPHDYTKALDLYKKLADKGNPDGEFFMGVMYEEGLGVAANTDVAIEWYMKAAKQGNVEAVGALRNLGITVKRPG